MKYYFIIVSALLFLSACSSSSTGRSQVILFSASELDQMGSSSFAEMKKQTPISKDKATNNFVQCVATAITKNVSKSVHKGDWEVVVFDSPQVNAFALPGGKIGVYTGILNVTENADQLAAIMGHEVAHVIEQHSNERLSANKMQNMGMAAATTAAGYADLENKDLLMAGLGLGIQYGAIMPYSRSHESEADIVGQDLMAKSGFEPSASVKLWQNMSKLGGDAPSEFMSTHPSNQTRIKQLSKHLPVAMKFYKGSTRPNCTKPNSIPVSKG